MDVQTIPYFDNTRLPQYMSKGDTLAEILADKVEPCIRCKHAHWPTWSMSRMLIIVAHKSTTAYYTKI